MSGVVEAARAFLLSRLSLSASRLSSSNRQRLGRLCGARNHSFLTINLTLSRSPFFFSTLTQSPHFSGHFLSIPRVFLFFFFDLSEIGILIEQTLHSKQAYTLPS